jgi:hypothetical protein
MNKRIQLFFSTEPFIDAKSRVELHGGIRLLLIGFEKLLSEFDVFFSYYNKNAFIEEVSR